MIAGIVEYKGKCKPFTDFREIRRGKNKGQIEVVVRLGTKTGIFPRKRLVELDQIRRFPNMSKNI